jgi:SAM-dependent methyltransferase
MSHEGDVVGARERFLARRPNNLRYLLEKRFGWMNDYIIPGTSALELGCGAGFLQMFVNNKVLLSDVEKRPWVDRVIDAMKISDVTESYDVVICSHMIHHVASPIKFFEDISSIVKPGGVVLINEIHTSLSMRFLLWLMKHEGYSYDVDVFDRDAVANDPKDPWSANCAIPEMLFRNREVFESRLPKFKIERYELNEFAIFPLSGGVIAKAKTVNLPNFVLRIIDSVDGVLIRMFPGIFAMASRIVLRRTI